MTAPSLGIDRSLVDRTVLGFGVLDEFAQPVALRLALDEAFDVGGHAAPAGACLEGGDGAFVEGDGLPLPYQALGDTGVR